MTEADYTEKTENIMSELEVSSIDNDKLDGLVVDAFSDEITFFKNSYIEDCLVERLGRPISVFGV